MLDGDELFRVKPCFLDCLLEVLSRLEEVLSSQWESPPVHSDRFLALQLLVHLDSLGRVHVLCLKKFSWLIGSDG